ncbi:MAG: hypothetical protein JSW10_08550 [Pseudomonadota bacterium]|nr:MAG: hypothetical protein JSW10_08550 [Pseudomonadota bacterium]
MMNRVWIAGIIMLTLVCIPYAVAVESKEATESHTGIGKSTPDSHTSDRDSETPITAGYEKNTANGFFIRSKDGKFRLNIGAYTQARYDINWREAPAGEDDVEKGFSLNRTRFFFEGQFTPMFDYHFRINIDDEGNSDLQVAYLQYNIDTKWAVRAGRQFLAMSREDWMLAQDVLTTEFSANDFTFAYGASNAVQAHYQGDRQRFWVALSDGANGAKKSFPNNNSTELALTGRWAYQVAGRDWSVWDDLVSRRGRPRGVLLGLAGGSQIEEDASAVDTSAQLNADISFNGNGYQAMLAASVTRHEPKSGPSFNNYGLLVQGGYFFTTHLQTYAQYNLVSPGDQPGDLETFHSITAGVSYFPFTWTNRWKFSAEIAHLFDALNKTLVTASGSLGWLPSDEDGQTYLRLQAQFGF